MPITDSDFYLSLISTDSVIEFPENKLSTFINRLARKITLSDQYEWLVGLYQIDHQKVVSDSSTEHHEDHVLTKTNVPKITKIPKKPSTTDEIVLQKTPDNNFILKSLEELISLMLKGSKNPNIYDVEYFKLYTNDDMIFKFNKTNEMSPNTSTQISFSVLDIVEDEEPTVSLLIPIQTYDTINEHYQNPTIKISTGKKYTGKQLIQKFLATIFEALHGFYSEEQLMSQHNFNLIQLHSFLSSRNKFMVKAAKKFVSIVQTERSVYGHNINKRDLKTVLPNFEMVYLDLIKPRFVGGGLNKIIYIFPIEFDSVVSQTPVNISYFSLNTKEFSEISIIILDENGNLVNIASGSFSTHVGLHFKKVLK